MYANAFPAAVTGTTTAFVCSHTKRLAVIVLFISMLVCSTATRIAASADELSPSLLKSCYELAADSIAACTAAVSSGKLSGLNLARAYVSRGLARQRNKEDNNAISDFNEAIKINSSDTQALNARGNSYLSLGQYDRAIEDYRLAIELNPKFVPAFFNIGLAYSTTRDFSRALDAYSQVIRIDPKNVSALNDRCYVNIMINDYDAAIRDCSEAVRLDPNHINSYLGLGNAYALLAAKQQKATTFGSNSDEDKTSADSDRAIIEYGRAITLDPTKVAAYIGRGHVFEAKGDYARALEDYNQAIQIGRAERGACFQPTKMPSIAVALRI